MIKKNIWKSINNRQLSSNLLPQQTLNLFSGLHYEFFFFLLKQSDNIKTLGRVKYSYHSWRIVVLLLSNHSNTYTVWSELYDTCIKIENNTFLSLTTPTAKCEWFVSAWQRDEMALFIYRLARLLITVLKSAIKSN